MKISNRMDRHQWDSAIDPQVVPLFLMLQWAQARSIQTMRPILIKHGLSSAEFDILATLRNSPLPHQMTPSQIQDQVVITSGGLTKVMIQLEVRGLVKRLQLANDMRVKPVRLTASGRRSVELAMIDVVGAGGQWIRSALDDAEIKSLTGLLAKLAEERDR